MSGGLLLAIGAVIFAVDVALGLYFLRRTPELLERNSDGSMNSPEASQRLGRLMLLMSPVPFLVLAALAFGLFGTIDGIETVQW